MIREPEQKGVFIMRIIPVALFVILFLIIGIPVLGIKWLIGKISKKNINIENKRLQH